MFAPATKSFNKLIVADPDSILNPIEELRFKKSETNWVNFGYNDKGDLVLFATGKGGFDELVQKFTEDTVSYSVLEAMVKGDEYNPIKFVLITWIGSKVSPGLGKARCAGHRPELLEFVKKKIAIAAEFQPSSQTDLTSKDIADKLTRISRQDTSLPNEKRHEMSRAHSASGDRSKSQAKVVNEDELIAALKKLQKGEDTWVALSYVEGKKDEIAYYKSGTGLDSLKAEFPKDKLIYAVVAQQVKETTTTTTKYLLLTIVGEKTGPLVKARSGTHRSELADVIKSMMPFHSHYQALSVADISPEKFLEKLRA